MAMLKIVFPLTFILSSIYMNVDTVSIRLIVDPVSLINIPIDVDELALSVSSVVFPVSFVTSPVWPDLFAEPISEATDPLAEESRTSFKSVELSILPFCIGVVNGFADRLFLLIKRKVAAVSSLSLSNQRNLLSGGVAAP
jgi:hypothetical protein